MSVLSDYRASHLYKKCRKRLSRLDGTSTAVWANSALWSLQSDLDAFGRSQDPAALVAARQGAVALLAAVDELLDKTS